MGGGFAAWQVSGICTMLGKLGSIKQKGRDQELNITTVKEGFGVVGVKWL